MTGCGGQKTGVSRLSLLASSFRPSSIAHAGPEPELVDHVTKAAPAHKLDLPFSKRDRPVFGNRSAAVLSTEGYGLANLGDG